MAAAREKELAELLVEALQEGGPQQSVDLVKRLNARVPAGQQPYAKETINKTLYNGPFHQKEKRKGGPVWGVGYRLSAPPGHSMVHIPGIGTLHILDTASDEQIRAIMAACPGLAGVEADDSALGLRALRIAAELQR
jgi:hypothetical protein